MQKFKLIGCGLLLISGAAFADCGLPPERPAQPTESSMPVLENETVAQGAQELNEGFRASREMRYDDDMDQWENEFQEYEACVERERAGK